MKNSKQAEDKTIIDDITTPNVFADMLVFQTALYNYNLALTGMTDPTTEMQSHLNAGYRLYRRYKNIIDEGYKFIETLTDKMSLDPIYKRNVERRGRPEDIVNLRGDFIKRFLSKARAHIQDLRDIFPAKSYRGINKLIQVVEEENPINVVIACDNITPASKSRIVWKWIDEARSIVGGAGDVRKFISEMEEASEIGASLPALEARMEAHDPLSEEYITLDNQRQEMLERLSDMSVEATAAAGAASNVKDGKYATETGRLMSLSPPQEDALMERGKVVIAAGAGSGKCIDKDTLVQTTHGWYKIGDLGIGLKPGEYRAATYDILGIDGIEKTSEIYHDGVSNCIRITTELGHSLTGTPDHKIKIKIDDDTVWKKLSDMSVGDVVCLDIRPGVFSSHPNSYNEKDAKYLASSINFYAFYENLPDELLQSSKNVIKTFLKSLIIDRYHADKIIIGNRCLANQLYTILLSFGVISKLSDIDEYFIEMSFIDGLHYLFTDQIPTDSFYYTYIKSIKHVQADTYDFVVPGTHSFSAGGFINHNTRVIVAKVVYHIKELGLEPYQIMATSFTRDAAKQLRERIEKNGIDLSDASLKDCFGTTHSIATRLLLKYNPRAVNFLKDYEQKNLLNMAMAQVGMKPNRRVSPPQKMGIFDNAGPSEDDTAVYRDTIKNAQGYFEWMIQQSWVKNKKWVQNVLNDLRFFQHMRPNELSQQQKDTLNGILDKVKGRNPPTYRVSSYTFDISIKPIVHIAADGDSKYWTTPANMWFNIEEPLKDAQENPLPSGEFQRAISKYKGQLTSPSDAWSNGDGAYAAVYGAYEWLKSADGDLEYIGKLDMDDVLIEASRVLIKNKKARQEVQSRYKCVLVDEAQDQNRTQDVLFGLITGYIDPNTLKPTDAPMTADTYAVIGDDKQCIDCNSSILVGGGKTVLAKYLHKGDVILSYCNGEIVLQTVKHILPSSWTIGFEIITESGKKLSMSPNHKIWASDIKYGFTYFDTVQIISHIDTVQIISHTEKGTQIHFNANPTLDKTFKNYRDALRYSDSLLKKTGGTVGEYISTKDGMIKLTRASHLKPGAYVIVYNQDNIKLEKIVSVKQVDGTYLDLDVEDASNFFGGGILSHNSIYEFRGAVPDEFINKSDLVDGGQFKTKLLTRNYRSGVHIVNAANKLISHNEKQIPMTCDAHEARKGMGQIHAESVGSSEQSAIKVAEEIEMMTKGDQSDAAYSDFGIAMRSNAEAYAYCMELLKRGIPFRSRVNPLRDPTIKAVLPWLKLASVGPDAPAADINSIVIDALKAPKSYLGDAFVGKLIAIAKSMPGKNYLRVLEREWDTMYGSRTRSYENVKTFTGNLLKIASMNADPSNIVDTVLNLTCTTGESLASDLMKYVKDNKDKMEELKESAGDGDITDSMIKEMALIPLEPILKILESQDFFSAMSYLKDLENANAKLSDDTQKNAVVVNTIHGWKGLEVPNLYLPIVRGKFPRKNTSEENLASDRRLAYVAITRAEDRCVVLDIPDPSATEQNPDPGINRFIAEACIAYA